MNKLDDIEIQKMLDEEPFIELPNSDDASNYRSVYSALKEEVPFELPTNFAHSVANLVDANNELSQLKSERIWFAIGAFTLVVTIIVALVLISAMTKVDISSYIPMVLGGSLLIMLIQYFDKKVKNLYLR